MPLNDGDIFDAMPTQEYSFDGLPELTQASNAPTVIERIDLAATKATAFMRQAGITLPDRNDVPTVDQTDYHLRELVNRAVGDYFRMREEARLNSRVIASVVGFVADDLFEVTVEPSKRGALTVSISLRLV